jgi:zinc D-Ala-D-Ala carboxypeptidase
VSWEKIKNGLGEYVGMTRLSEHFTLSELTKSETALRKGIPNDPDEETVGNLMILAQGLEEVRKLLGHPIHINSAYRSPKVNSAVGGSKNSAHMKGFAADFTCPGFGTVNEVCHAILDSTINFDQCISEFGAWVHISFAPELRRMALTIDKTGTRAGIT